MSKKPTVLLEHYLKELKLPTFLREYAKIAEISQKDRADYQTFLLRLAEREIQDREIRARCGCNKQGCALSDPRYGFSRSCCHG